MKTYELFDHWYKKYFAAFVNSGYTKLAADRLAEERAYLKCEGK